MSKIEKLPVEKGRKLVNIPWTWIEVLLFTGTLPLAFRVPEIQGLPKTARICGVWSDFARQSFALVFEDASFEPAAEGAMMEQLAVRWRVAKLEDTGMKL